MKRDQLEHPIRAAGSITGCREIHVIGSQAVLASVTTGPEELFVSREADMFVDQRPDLSDLIDGSIGGVSARVGVVGWCADAVSPPGDGLAYGRGCDAWR